MSARRPAALGLLVAVAGCGGSTDSSPAGPGVEVSLEQDPGGRLVVAEVDGVPIYGDCVAAHAAETDGDRRRALAACIDIEVLVREARRRGLAADPEVAAAGKREMVRALIQREFYDHFDGPEDVPLADVRGIWDKGLKNFFNRKEHRSVFYCRAENPDPKTKKTPPGGDADRRAKKVAEAIWARVRGRADLSPAELAQICRDVGSEVGGARVSTGSFRAFPKVGRAVPEFALPSFAIPEIGTVGPPARTPWGYDLILLTEIIKARQIPFDEAADQIRAWMFSDPRYEGYRKFRFEQWLADMMGSHRLERFDENFPASEPVARRPD